jgi:TonB family protein
MLEPSRASERYRATRYPEGEVSGLPMVINTPQRRSGVPWLSTALVFVTFSAITFAVLAVNGTESGHGKIAQIMRVIFPSGDLGLRVESQGDRLLLSWNRRNAAVTSASDGMLQIFDGTLHREVKLDGGQVADGSVLYKPLSQDVTFRLEVHGAEQSSAMGSIRVLDATASVRETTPILDLTNAPAATPKAAPQGPPISPLPVPDTVRAAAEKAAADKATARNAERGQVVVYRNPESARVVPLPVRNIANNTTGNVVSNPDDNPEKPSSPKPATQNGASAAPSVQQPPPAEAKADASKAERTTDATAAGSSQQQNAMTSVPRPASPRPDTPRQTASVGSGSSQPPNAGSTISGWDSSAPEAPRSSPAPAASTSASDLEPKAPVFVPPKPLSQVMPDTRSLAPGLISQATRVEVAVRIDNAGHVLSAHVLNENGNTKGALSGAAIAAARQWTFQPATLQGEKVESEHTIVFEFRPENQQ